MDYYGIGFSNIRLPNDSKSYIYKYDSKEDGVVIDKNKLFAKVYGINWYPSFLLISDTNCEFVGEANQEELKDILEGFKFIH